MAEAHLKQLQTKAVDMLQWLDTMCHPDGEIAFFNDAVFNVAPSLQPLGHMPTASI